MYDYDVDAKILWDYHHLNQPVTQKDCILAFGSHDLHVAERAGEMFLKGYGNYVIFTGGLGRITKKIWHKSEARKFAEVAIDMGVPASKIAIEENSTNTGENIKFTKKMLQECGKRFQDFIVVDKPFKERRIYATLKKQWESLRFIVTSPQYSYDEYKSFYNDSPELTVDDFINIMVGDLQRIDLYGKNGFQIPQEIPQDVQVAYQRLVEYGFSKQLIK